MARVYRVSRRKKRSIFGGLNVTLTLILINVIAFILFALLISSNIAILDYIAAENLF